MFSQILSLYNMFITIMVIERANENESFFRAPYISNYMCRDMV